MTRTFTPSPIPSPAAETTTRKGRTGSRGRGQRTASRLELIARRPRLTRVDDLCVWSWATSRFDWRLIWLAGALDFHVSYRGHQPDDTWHTERVPDRQCDGSPAHAGTVAARIMHDHGAGT